MSQTIQELEEELQEIEQTCEQSNIEWQFQGALREYRGPDQVINFKDFKMEGTPKNHIKSGIVELDGMIGGFGKGDIILITGDTGDGKSTFSRFLIRKLAEQNKKSLVFSYEESNFEFLSKFRGDLPDGCLPKILSDKNPTWIERKVVEGIAKFGVECVFIDNLKGIIDYGSPKNLTTEIDFVIQKLKEIAMKYNIVLFLVAHIKKEDGKAIDKNSVKDSKTIVDTASIGLALCRVKQKQTKKQEEEEGIKYTDYTSFYLIKNRYTGKYDNFSMLFHANTGLYSENPKGNIVNENEIKELTKEIDVNTIKF